MLSPASLHSLSLGSDGWHVAAGGGSGGINEVQIVANEQEAVGTGRRRWIQLSSMDTWGAGRLGRTHTDYHGSYPGWGDDLGTRHGHDKLSIFNHVFVVVDDDLRSRRAGKQKAPM